MAADTSFLGASAKLIEHYGIEICGETIRKITLNHAEQIMEKIPHIEKETKTSQMIAETDGSMVPIVSYDSQSKTKDKRKHKKLLWKEARLCLVRDNTKSSAVFRATLGSTSDLGKVWEEAANIAGFGDHTKVHCLGDGALWIKEQSEIVFGTQHNYLVDFYHVSEYLAEAAKECAPDSPKEWVEEQQLNLKKGDLYRVLQNLEGKEGLCRDEVTIGVLNCYCYLTNRLDQLDYLGALIEGLPIGSGEIESAHRHVIQKRMKRPGTWWLVENADLMLQLCCNRSSGEWNEYWEQYHPSVFQEAC